jgi:hypothetical protein
MNPYNLPEAVIRKRFVSEPFYDTIAVINLTVIGTAAYQVFSLGPVNRIGSTALNIPVDLTPVVRNTDDSNWASNTTLDEATGSVDETPGSGSDFYVANQGDNTIVRMRQDGMVIAIRQVMVNGQPRDNISLNGIAASTDATDTTPPSTIARPLSTRTAGKAASWRCGLSNPTRGICARWPCLYAEWGQSDIGRWSMEKRRSGEPTERKRRARPM